VTALRGMQLFNERFLLGQLFSCLVVTARSCLMCLITGVKRCFNLKNVSLKSSHFKH